VIAGYKAALTRPGRPPGTANRHGRRCGFQSRGNHRQPGARCWPVPLGTQPLTKPFTLPGTKIRLHDIRHTHGTLLIKAGVPVKVVSERLGHGNPAFTIETYQHVLPGMQGEAARLVSCGRLDLELKLPRSLDDLEVKGESRLLRSLATLLASCSSQRYPQSRENDPHILHNPFTIRPPPKAGRFRCWSVEATKSFDPHISHVVALLSPSLTNSVPRPPRCARRSRHGFLTSKANRQRACSSLQSPLARLRIGS
jgi:hypothetical protein